MVFNTIFNTISVISQQLVNPSMLSCNSSYQHSAQYSVEKDCLHFSPFLTMFSILPKKGSIVESTFTLWSANALNLYHTISFGLVRIESICRWQMKYNWKIEICFGKGRKHCRKRRKCWLPAFSPFSTMFSKGFFLRVVKSRDYVIKS